jgi:hypothetical protein
MLVPAFQFLADHSIMLVPPLHFLTNHLTMSVPAPHFQLAIYLYHFTFTCISIGCVGLPLREGGGDSAGPFDLIQYFYLPHGNFSQWIFRSMDILPYGHFALRMFLPCGYFTLRKFCPADISSRGHFIPADNSLRRQLAPWTTRPMKIRLLHILFHGHFAP